VTGPAGAGRLSHLGATLKCGAALLRHHHATTPGAWARWQGLRLRVWLVKASLRAVLLVPPVENDPPEKIEPAREAARDKEGKKMTTDTHAVPTIIATRDPRTGAGLPMCSIECLGEWSRNEPGRIVLGSSPATWETCSHCAGCGRIIRVPATCELHDGGCPVTEWIATLAAGLVLWHIGRLTSAPATDALVEHAEHLATRFPEMTPFEIASVVTGTDPDEEG
jgi:hypothetical protein